MAQVAALIIAAIWTWYLFGQKEAPSLAPRGELGCSISWEDNSMLKNCRAFFNVNFKNTGNSTIEIEKVNLTAWQFDKLTDTSRDISFLNIEEIKKFGNKIFEKTFTGTEDDKDVNKMIPFIGNYPPGSAYNTSYPFDVRNNNEKYICFVIELFNNDRSYTPSWVSYSWDGLCNFRKTENPH